MTLALLPPAQARRFGDGVPIPASDGGGAVTSFNMLACQHNTVSLLADEMRAPYRGNLT